MFLASCGCIPPLCQLLVCQEVQIINMVLDGIDNILKVGSTNEKFEFRPHKDTTNPFALEVDECGGLDKIEELLYHTDDEIYEKALRIIEHYFSSDPEENSELSQQINDKIGYS